jgi:hypothetical protein
MIEADLGEGFMHIPSDYSNFYKFGMRVGNGRECVSR